MTEVLKSVSNTTAGWEIQLRCVQSDTANAPRYRVIKRVGRIMDVLWDGYDYSDADRFFVRNAAPLLSLMLRLEDEVEA